MKLILLARKTLLAISLPVLCLQLMSCATTPQTRMDKHPEMFAEQSAKHQELIRKGKIVKGMNKDAVYLSWGEASKKVDMFENNVPSTRWDYIKQKPSFTQSIYGGFVYGDGYRPYYRPYGYGPFDYYNSGLGLGTGVQYTPVRTATVLFKDEKVSSWETER